MIREYQQCNRCIMDTTDPEITFDEKGFCNHCTSALEKLNKFKFTNSTEKKIKLSQVITAIKDAGKGKKYDCIIGLSGGVDSSYLAYVVVKEFGLRPLAVHVDNGWDSELAVLNIENIVKKLNIDLYTWVINWQEFRDLQRAYLKASVVDIEVLSDNAIVIAIHKLLKKFNIKYFLIGHNYQAETIMPYSWIYTPKYDSLNIKTIYKKFGSGSKLKTYPLLSSFGYIKYRFFNKSISTNILDLIDYKKDDAISLLNNELNWRDYGGKHYESKITQFYQCYILPNKFNIDKRKAHLSSLICSGQIERNQALEELSKPLFSSDLNVIQDIEYFIKKLGFTLDEFNTIMKAPINSHFEYSGYNRSINHMRILLQKLFKFFHVA